MHRYVRIDLDRIEEYRARIQAFARELKERFHVSRVILFGSFAKDDVHELSDIDLIVIGEVPGRFVERIGAVRDLTDLPVEPLVYTPDEWRRMVDEGNSFAEEVLATGIDLLQ